MNLINRNFKKVYQHIIDRPYSKKETLANRYEIIKLIGKGSYGITYLCNDLYSKQMCVVKQMRKSKKKEIVDMYKHETAALKILDHPCIPSLMETFTYGKNQFFSMEFIVGENLEDALFKSEERFSERDALVLINQLMKLIHYFHGCGITHGDIRIPNVIITDDKVHLIDFGLASFLPFDNQKEKTEKVQDDFYDLGEFLLYLLYSTYDYISKKERPWTEELDLNDLTVKLLKRLLMIENPYGNSAEILKDLEKAIATFSPATNP